MKKTLKRLAMLSVAMLLAFAGCEKEPEKDLDDDTGNGLPEVLTNEVSTITANSAVCVLIVSRMVFAASMVAVMLSSFTFSGLRIT